MYRHWKEEASFSDLIISQLLSCGSLRVQRKILYELVKKRRRLNNKVFNNNLYRLRQRGILSIDYKSNIVINRNRLKRLILFSNIKSRPTGKVKIMVLFDIPEKKRKVRNWLRTQLKFWNFEMIQQSVWLGGGPLPDEFNNRLRMLGVDKGVRILKVQSIKT